jgi:type IV secretory pathway VirJ component
VNYLYALIIACMLCTVHVQATEQTEQFGRFGTVHLYYSGTPGTNVVLFISGDGGWNLGVVEMARQLAAMNTLVVGIDIIHYLKQLESADEKCSYPSGDFEMLSKYIQKKMGLPVYHVPILVGYSSGATLAYALAAQAPHGTFKAALSLGFCPDLPLTKPFCAGSGVTFEPWKNGKGYNFLPKKDLQILWVTFHGSIDQVCSVSVARQFVSQTGNAKMVELPKVGHGFSVEKNWLPQFKQIFSDLAKEEPAPIIEPKQNADVSGLPLIEVASQGQQRDIVAILLTGDGGWAGLDREIAGALSSKGISVVGWNSLQYYWTERSPEEAARDLDKIIAHYSTVWNKKTVVCIGYSFGADVLPFLINRLPKQTGDKVKLVAYLGLSPSADFAFHISDWLGGGDSKTARPVLPELNKITGKTMLYFYGTDEKESMADKLNSGKITCIPLSGGHHLGGHYDAVVDAIVARLGK